MLRSNFLLSNLLVLLMFSILSCSKNNNPTSPGGFTWTHEGVTYTATISGAYEQSVALAPYNILAIIGTNINTNFSTKISFSLTAFNTGSYSVIVGGTNRLTFFATNGNNYSGVGGQVNITSNSNSLLSGNFSVTVNTPSPNTTLSGSFSNIPIKP